MAITLFIMTISKYNKRLTDIQVCLYLLLQIRRHDINIKFIGTSVENKQLAPKKYRENNRDKRLKAAQLSNIKKKNEGRGGNK